MGKREPIRFTGVYPTMFGVSQVENIEALTLQAAPLLKAFLFAPRLRQPSTVERATRVR
jgi:hypothetical protein